MKRLLEILFATVIAAPLAALAQPTLHRMGDHRFGAVHVGRSRDEVRAQLGAPDATRSSTDRGRADSARWTYRYTDTWGMSARFDVMFDANGKVASISELRTQY